ncbi:hypothetical protein Daus18300_000204 [Diaporthe australafricana]|uniref:Uncharacterized protein n=1 Tax=Diaporthe australafricana TaxID=127596 RepID=A0ABR3Y710_9PEZI
MSTFTNGAIASPKKRRKLMPTPDPKLDDENDLAEAPKLDEDNDMTEPPKPDEDNDLTEAPVKVGGYLPPEQIDAEIDQYSDPPESPDEYSSEVVKQQGLGGFMSKVQGRLRTIKNSDQRANARQRFTDLIRQLKIDTQAQPPYDQAAAVQMQSALEKWGLGETLLLDFEMQLHRFEALSQEHREKVEKLAEENKAEQRKKQEWDVVNEEDADDPWEVV